MSLSQISQIYDIARTVSRAYPKRQFFTCILSIILFRLFLRFKMRMLKSLNTTVPFCGLRFSERQSIGFRSKTKALWDELMAWIVNI